MTKQQAIEYIEMYFTYNVELRTIADEETGVVSKSWWNKNKQTLDEETIIMMGEDAQYETKAECWW
jgi:hypothetical protein